MTKKADRHYVTDPGEKVTFHVQNSMQVALVTDGNNRPLPVTVPGKSGQVQINVAYAGSGGGRAVIRVTGSAGGTDDDDIPQLGPLPASHAFYTVD